MTKGAIICFSFSFLLPFTAFATRYECTGNYEGETETIRVSIDDESGIYTEWSTQRMGKKLSGNYVGGLCHDTEEWGYEWIENFRASNGASILEMGTTADSFKIAVSESREKARFDYADLGSGSGNHSFDLECKALEGDQ